MGPVHSGPLLDDCTSFIFFPFNWIEVIGGRIVSQSSITGLLQDSVKLVASKDEILQQLERLSSRAEQDGDVEPSSERCYLFANAW